MLCCPLRRASTSSFCCPVWWRGHRQTHHPSPVRLWTLWHPLLSDHICRWFSRAVLSLNWWLSPKTLSRSFKYAYHLRLSSLSRTSNCKSGSFLKACLESWTQLVVHHDSVHRSRWITLLDNHNGYPGCLVFTFSLLFDSIVVWETMVSLYSKNIGKTLCYVKPVQALNPWSEKSNWHGL